MTLLALILAAQEVEVLSAYADKTPVQPGDVVRVEVRIRVKEHFHLYATTSTVSPVHFAVETPNVAIAGKIEEPEPKMTDIFGTLYPTHEGEVTLGVPIRIGRVPDGPLEIALRIQGQACDDKNCFDVDVPFEVSGRHLDNFQTGLAAAKAEKKPIFLEFTGSK